MLCVIFFFSFVMVVQEMSYHCSYLAPRSPNWFERLVFRDHKRESTRYTGEFIEYHNEHINIKIVKEKQTRCHGNELSVVVVNLCFIKSKKSSFYF